MGEIADLRRALSDSRKSAAASRDAMRRAEDCLKVVALNPCIVLAGIDRELRYTWLRNPHPDFDDVGALGRRDDELAQNSGTVALMDLKRRILASGKCLQETIAFPVSDGARHYIVHGAPSLDERGEVDGLTTISIDITPQIHAHELRVSAVERLAQEVAHEINNPLQQIRLNAQFALQDTEGSSNADDKAIANRARNIDTGAKRCAEIVQSLLLYARRSAPAYRVLGLCDIVRAAVADAAVPAGVTPIAATLPEKACVFGDESQLLRVVSNLLANAIHAGAGEVVVEVVVSNVEVTLTVRDDGCGMAEDVLERAFEPFFTTKSQGEGTGLGLAISRGIVESHRGGMCVASTPGVGTTFTVKLPLIALREGE